MRTKSEIGKIGEDICCEFLKEKKYRILVRNHRVKHVGEIDVIARGQKGVLVFVEVKTLAGPVSMFIPEMHFNEEKRLRVRRLAQGFANRYPQYVNEKLGYRIDLVAIAIKDPLASIKNWHETCDIRQYENL